MESSARPSTLVASYLRALTTRSVPRPRVKARPMTEEAAAGFEDAVGGRIIGIFVDWVGADMFA